MNQAHITLYFQHEPIWWFQQLEARQYHTLLLERPQPTGEWHSQACLLDAYSPQVYWKEMETRGALRPQWDTAPEADL